MSEPDNKIYLPVSDMLAYQMAELAGAATVLHAIANEADAGKNAPGFRLAIARAEATVADMRASHAGRVLRAVAAAGYDIGKHPNVYSGMRDGKYYLALEPEDLLSGLEP